MPKHGYAHKERLYEIWKNMRRRCRDENNPAYPEYGGRGISICPEWDEYILFRNWAMSNGYNDELTLDRIDNNAEYSPQNCRWCTHTVQNNNRRDNRIVTFNGEVDTLANMCREYGLKYKAVWKRLSLGWSLYEAMTRNIEVIRI